MSVGIFPGKFQPFHNGHLLVVKGMMTASSRVVIVVCHGEEMGPDDLFSKMQVQEMISSALLSEDILDAEIVFVSDCDEDAEWADKVLEAAGWPEDGKVWSSSETVRALFEEIGKESQRVAPVPGIDGEEIRGWIKAGDTQWRSKLPAGAIDTVQNLVDSKAA
jgi:nicotinamide-nucleotide adenylyltransferase